MNRNRQPKSLVRFLLRCTGLAALTLLPSAALGQQQTPHVIEIAIDADKEKAAAVKGVDLRPNTPTELGFELKNFAGEILGDVTLKIVQVVGGQERVLTEAKIPKLDKTPDKAKGLLVQMFDKIKGGPDKLELIGPPPFKVQLHVQAKNLPLRKRELHLVIREPKDYVAATAAYNPTEGVLRVDVEPRGEKTFIGLHQLPVQLVLGPDVKPTKQGNFKQTLTGFGQKPALLFAEEFAFERKLSEGDVYLKVDGYDRAFTYQVKENASGAINPRSDSEIRVRIGSAAPVGGVPRYAKPSKVFEVPLEIDGPLSGDYKVRVGLDRTGDTVEPVGDDLQELAGLRQQKVTLSVSPEGKLVCKAEVSDWRVQFATEDLARVNIKFRVSVIRQGEKVKLAVVPESRPLVARTATDDRASDVKSVFALVTLDDSKPEGIKLALPKDNEWPVETPLEVRASIKERKATQAPIARALLIRGKGPKDDKEEPDVLAEGVFDPKQKDWKFTLPGQAKPEPLTVSVLFTTVTGAKDLATDTISFKLGAGGKKLYTVKGRVVYAERGQPDLDVTLMDGKRNVKGTAKTGEGGAFVFTNVEPGIYFVESAMSFRKLTGTTKLFEVPEKGKKEVNVTVTLK